MKSHKKAGVLLGAPAMMTGAVLGRQFRLSTRWLPPPPVATAYNLVGSKHTNRTYTSSTNECASRRPGATTRLRRAPGPVVMTPKAQTGERALCARAKTLQAAIEEGHHPVG